MPSCDKRRNWAMALDVQKMDQIRDGLKNPALTPETRAKMERALRMAEAQQLFHGRPTTQKN